MALDNPKIHKWKFQRGPLYGYDNLHAAVKSQQNGNCIFCKEPIAHYHHVVPRSKRGSDTIDNIVGLCVMHHDLVHKDHSWAEKLIQKKAGINKKYGALSVLNQVIKPLTDILAEKYPGMVFLTSGKSTKEVREAYNLEKDHNVDAYCIALSVLTEAFAISKTNNPYRILQFRRHDRQCCQQAMLNRKYYDASGKLVATNRHKATEQKFDSLDEYRIKTGSDCSKLVTKEHPPRYKRLNRLMPGAVLQYKNKIFVMQSSSGLHNGKPIYFVSTCGERYLANKCKAVVQNKGLVYA